MADEMPLQNGPDAVVAMLRSHEARIAKLEAADQTTTLKRLTTSATTSALIFGLILTIASLWDVFVSKPEADRIARISQFNQAVNSAAKTRQELAQALNQSADPNYQLAVQSAATPRILTDVSTARAMLRDLTDADVGIPQLIVLISESFTTGDMVAAKDFVGRAVGKTDATPYLRSEAKRYEGKLNFATGSPGAGRQSYQEALNLLGTTPGAEGQVAYDRGDLALAEFFAGSCDNATADFTSFVAAVHAPGVGLQVRRQLAATASNQLGQMQGSKCPLPPNLSALLAD